MRKKFIILTTILSLICIFLTINIFSEKAHAESVYMRVITEETPFYQNADDINPLFYLPYTYYVKVLESNASVTHVECYGNGGTAAIDGFVPTDYLFKDDLAVENPYVVLSITTVGTAVLYEDFTLSNPVQYIFADRELNYYGSLNHESGKIFYVSYNGRLGYVKEAEVFPFSIPNHPNELTFLTPETPTPTPETPNSATDGVFGLKVAIIVCLIFAGVVALFFALGKKQNQTATTAFYDENDYE